MPFYRTSELKMEDIGTGNPGEYQPILGDLMKAGVVTYYRGTGTKPHWHNVDEQFFYVTEGKCLFLLGEEEKLIEEGDIVYIPRGTMHVGRSTTDKCVIWTTKSPAEEPSLGADHHYPENMQEIIDGLEKRAEALYE